MRAAVWLASNAGGMTPDDKAKVMRELLLTQGALDVEARGQVKSMAAYTSRLIAHWIKKHDQLDGSADQTVQPTPFVTASLNSHFFDAQWGQQPVAWQPDLGQNLTVSEHLGAFERCGRLKLTRRFGRRRRTAMGWAPIRSSTRL